MAIQPIRLYPDPILRKLAKPVKRMTVVHHVAIQDLADTLKAQPGGIGIAAPQIGIPWQIAIVDVSAKEKGRKRLILINPVIVDAGEPLEGREGCMSVPDYTGNVVRYRWVRVRWHDEHLICREATTTGVEAVCIQHEVDHLTGHLFLDRVSSIKTGIFRRKTYL